MFLVGAERSGTTLLRLMLDHHPGLAFRNEFEFAVDLVEDGGSLPHLEQYYTHLGLSRTFAMSGFTIDQSLDYPSLVKSFLEQKRVRDGKSRVGATIHRHFLRILHIWPDARFIHIVRDGRDVARSRVQMGWNGNAWTGSFEWVRVEREIEELATRVGTDRIIQVTYEELVADTPAVLTRICEFMGLTYDPAMLEFDRDSTYEKPDARASQRWRTKASPKEIGLIEGVQGEMLVKRGYELSGHPIRRPGAVGRAWLRLHSRIVCSVFRLRRFGLSIWVKENLARRLHLRQLGERTQLQINEIQKAYLK